MIIKQITYARLKQMPNNKFENERVEVTAELSGQDSPKDVFEQVKTFTNQCLEEKIVKKLGRGRKIPVEDDNIEVEMEF
jgi:hypothetical protein